MPTYRVYYAEREAGRNSVAEYPYHEHMRATYGPRRDAFSETEWEEEIEGRDAVAALEAFFREHVRERSDVMWLDERGESRPIEGVSDYDPGKTYIWVENDKLMEYQGIDEATPGMVSCPFCGGSGEVTLEVADEYLAASGEREAEEGSWG